VENQGFSSSRKQKIEELNSGRRNVGKGKKKVEDTAKKIKIVVNESKIKAKEAEDYLS
jgi:hypothetical protein